MIFQNPNTSLNPVYTIGNQLIEIANLHLQLFGDDAISSASAALEEVGIERASERLFDYPHKLPLGMQQRVMIAMALMCEPDILIADEARAALDVTIQAHVMKKCLHGKIPDFPILNTKKHLSKCWLCE